MENINLEDESFVKVRGRSPLTIYKDNTLIAEEVNDTEYLDNEAIPGEEYCYIVKGFEI